MSFKYVHNSLKQCASKESNEDRSRSVSRGHSQVHKWPLKQTLRSVLVNGLPGYIKSETPMNTDVHNCMIGVD